MVNPTLQNGYVVCASVGSVSVAVVFALCSSGPPAKEKFKQETLRGRNGCVTSTVGSSTRSTCSSVEFFFMLAYPFLYLALAHHVHLLRKRPAHTHQSTHCHAQQRVQSFGPRRLSLLSACFKWGVRQDLHT